MATRWITNPHNWMILWHLGGAIYNIIQYIYVHLRPQKRWKGVNSPVFPSDFTWLYFFGDCHVMYNWLVVDLPLWKMMEFVSWGYEVMTFPIYGQSYSKYSKPPRSMWLNMTSLAGVNPSQASWDPVTVSLGTNQVWVTVRSMLHPQESLFSRYFVGLSSGKSTVS
jgi:hypothetical protein